MVDDEEGKCLWHKRSCFYTFFSIVTMIQRVLLIHNQYNLQVRYMTMMELVQPLNNIYQLLHSRYAVVGLIVERIVKRGCTCT